MRRLPAGFDLEATSRASGAFVRARGVPGPEALLRLALIYGATDLSLRGTAAWAEAAGLASLSDVALLGRLQAASAWMGELTSALMTAAQGGGAAGRRVRLLDATSFAAAGATKATWRVHADYDLERSRFTGFQLTDGYAAERLTRFTIERGDIVVGDRIYAHNAGALRAVVAAGGDFLVRRGRTSCRVLALNGAPFDHKAVLAGLGFGKTAEFAVLVPVGDGPALRARLVVHHMPRVHAEAASARTWRQTKGKAGAKQMQSAEFVMLLTSLPRRSFPAADLLALYRLRWQIEIAFKRLKSLVGPDALLAKDAALVRTAICAKLIVALLTEDLLAEVLDSPPSAAEIEAVALASLQDRAGDHPRRHPRQDHDPRRPRNRESKAPLQEPRRAQTTTKTAAT